MPSLEAFPILPITDDLIVQDEPMGSKDKFWCQLPDDAAVARCECGCQTFPPPR